MMDEKPDIVNETFNIETNHEDYPKPFHGTITGLELEQAEKELQHFAKRPIDDPNLDERFVHDAEQALEAGDVKNKVTLGHLIEEDSPYPEVRASISNVDDVDMPVVTLRTILLGLITTIVVPGLNQFLSLRYPTTTITPYCVTIIIYPFGQFLAWCLPAKTWKTKWGAISLNPGPFNVKEHSLISIMALMSYQSAYATSIPAVQKYTYNMADWGFGYGILLIWSTQLLGLSFACFCRRFLVWPGSMIWPTTLPTCTLLNSMHGIKSENFTGMSRIKFFWTTFAVLFFYQFFPSYIFTMLSIGNWFCTIAPKNVVLNQVLGTQSGLGLLPFTFDWTVIGAYVSPLSSPWWSQANLLAGFVIFFVIVCPAMYYTNTWNAKYMPIFDTGSFDRFGNSYAVSKIIRLSSDGLSPPILDIDSYNRYSMVYLPSGLTISYFLSFASVTAVLVHVGLFHGKAIWKQIRSDPMETTDIHMRLMLKYKESPIWWYLVLFFSSFAMGIGAVEGWPTDLPWWAFLVAILIGMVFILPVGIVLAVSNQEVGLNMISELIIGYMLPGRPIAMMIFKTTMYMITYQGLQFVQDQKMAHYMKLPPRSVFAVQVLATMVGGLVQLAVQSWAFDNINDICKEDQPEKFTCANNKVFGTASIVWGLIGPANMFSMGKRYNPLLYGFLVGAIAPVIVWFLAKKFPKARFHLINLPVIFTGTGNIPPATGVNYLAPIIIGFFTQYVWKRSHFKSWYKFNYILSAALQGASAIAVVFIFFVLQYVHGSSDRAPNQKFYKEGWWGNSAWQHTADYEGAPLWTLPKHVGFEGTPNEVGQPYVG